MQKSINLRGIYNQMMAGNGEMGGQEKARDNEDKRK